MKSIELRAALIEANEINLNGADALVETSVLKQLIESCKTRISDLDPEAKKLARKELKKLKARSGKFEHNGHHYTLDVDEIYDLIGKPQKYTMSEAVLYRQKAREQQEYKDKSAGLTKDMRNILEQFPTGHPNIEPDSEKTNLKCLD